MFSRLGLYRISGRGLLYPCIFLEGPRSITRSRQDNWCPGEIRTGRPLTISEKCYITTQRSYYLLPGFKPSDEEPCSAFVTRLIHVLLDALVISAKLRSINCDEGMTMCVQLEGIEEEAVAVYLCFRLKWWENSRSLSGNRYWSQYASHTRMTLRPPQRWYEIQDVVRYNVMYSSEIQLTFLKNLSPQSSGWKSKPSKKLAPNRREAKSLLWNKLSLMSVSAGSCLSCFWSWRWSWYISPNHRPLFELHSSTI
jgi:hypothetical protein